METSHFTNFKNLSKVLASCEKVAKLILSRSLKTMQDLMDPNSEIVDDFLDELLARESSAEISRSDALSILQNCSLEWVSDAERVVAEIPYFVTEEDSKYFVNANCETCPFLTEVWNGDTYDLPEIEGLRALLTDLQNQLGNITVENLVSRASKMGLHK